MSCLLERYGLIGDGETAALVSDRGSIDWLCLPRFDSPACCAALIGTHEHGYWSIAPEEPITEALQRYVPDTLILETDLSIDAGSIRLTDFMPIRGENPLVVRIVSGLSGSVLIRATAAMRFDYGHMPPWIEQNGDAISCKAGPDEVVFHGFSTPDISDSIVQERFVLSTGEQRVFMLTHRSFDRNQGQLANPKNADDLLEQTQRYWRHWIGRLERHGEFSGSLRRSLLTLKALVHRPTGGLVAAPTTSLPEKPGGKLNWDYRYCWLRDASFTVRALIDSGFHEEAKAWRDWILRAVAGAPEKMAIAYRVDGSRRLQESELPWLPGYRFAKPVRIGNAAAGQFQLDVYGELMDTLHICEAAGMEKSSQMRHLERAIAEHVSRVWTEPDQGLWENRGEPHHYTYSKVMAWVAIDRFLSGSGRGDMSDEACQRFEKLRSRIHDVVCEEGFDEGLGSFTDTFGGERVDASLLLLPRLGFLPAKDPRMAATIATIEERLMKNGLVYRNSLTDPPPEGAFLACTLWLAECQMLQGRVDQAKACIERVLGLAGPLGLLSEEYDAGSKRLTGNFPQALTHIALVNAILLLERGTS